MGPKLVDRCAEATPTLSQMPTMLKHANRAVCSEALRAFCIRLYFNAMVRGALYFSRLSYGNFLPMSVAAPLSTASGRKTIINSRIVHAAPPLNQVGICHNFRWVPASAIAGPRSRHSIATTTDPAKGCEESPEYATITNSEYSSPSR